MSKLCSIVWDRKDWSGHPLYFPAKHIFRSLMPLSVPWRYLVTLKSPEDRVSTAGFLWETMLLKCMIHRNLPCTPITHNHHLSLLSSPACSLLSCPLSPVLALFQTVVMQRAFRGIVFFIFIWSCAQLTAQESFPLSTGMLCVLQGEPSQPSICFVPLLLVCTCSCVYPCHLQCFCPHCRAWWGVLP